jgi:DNA repair exonuclease SbcCD nuclease subunit
MVRILHTADWQLGKQFENLGAPSDNPRQEDWEAHQPRSFDQLTTVFA